LNLLKPSFINLVFRVLLHFKDLFSYNVLLNIVKAYVHITIFYNFNIFFDIGNGKDKDNFYNIFTI